MKTETKLSQPVGTVPRVRWMSLQDVPVVKAKPGWFLLLLLLSEGPDSSGHSTRLVLFICLSGGSSLCWADTVLCQGHTLAPMHRLRTFMWNWCHMTELQAVIWPWDRNRLGYHSQNTCLLQSVSFRRSLRREGCFLTAYCSQMCRCEHVQLSLTLSPQKIMEDLDCVLSGSTLFSFLGWKTYI